MSSYKYIEKDGEIVAIPDPIKVQEARQKKYQLFLEKSNLPEFYWNINFEDYKGNIELEPFKKIKYYADNIDNDDFKFVNIYLWGSQGVQKTALECNILKAAMKKGLRAKFILAGDLIDTLMKLQGFSYKEDLYNQIEDLKHNYDIIAIDDIGDIQKSMMWSSESKNLIITEWDRFLRKVLYNGTKVIMTSNFDVTIFKQYFGESIYSLMERNFETIHLTDSIKEIRKLNVSAVFDNMYRRSTAIK